MKKVIIILVLLIIVFFVIFEVSKPSNPTLLIDNENYKDIAVDNIISIVVRKSTEGGIDTEVVTEKNEIEEIFNKLSKIKIGKETEMACDDNSTLYTIYFDNNDTKTIEIECDWIIIGKKRYEIEWE